MKNSIACRLAFYKIILVIFLLPEVAFSQSKIWGEVSDEVTGEKISGAVVSVENSFAVAVTDAKGVFTFHNFKNENTRIRITHLAYEDYSLEMKPVESPVIIRMKPRIILADEVNVIATRAGDKSAMAYTNIKKDEFEKQNLGQDLPYLINLTPSVVVTSDAGSGVGYTAIRIRGSDATRVNVTINGIPVNDAEAHQVYWVDLPDFPSSVDNIQVQRGIGTSTNGSGAFGGSINIQSSKLSMVPFASVGSSYGSFRTMKNTVQFGTGLINSKFSFEGRLSKITSDGYIDRAFSDLKSFYLSGGYYGNKSSLRMILFSGKEKTYQAWYGVPEDSLKTNRTFNPAGIYYDSNGNIQYYRNQTDNYQQDYYQLLFSRSLNINWNLNAALHYTKGRGYYEEYETHDDTYGNGLFSTYGLPDPVINGDTVTSTDLIRQRWLDNDFYGFTFSAGYSKNKLQFIFGGAGNQYNGKHFDEITWMQYNAGAPFPYRYSDNDAIKKDFNIFAKANYDLTSRMNIFCDLQIRTIGYEFPGFNNDLQSAQEKVRLNFFNPKAGVSFDLKQDQKLYASLSVGHKEPVRDDYVQSSPASRPKPEEMQDLEAGYKLRKEKFAFSFNYYFMNYKNQLILTGKINDVGAYIRQNVEHSFRSGIEMEVAYAVLHGIRLSGNVTVSRNKIKTYYEYIDDYDNGVQILNVFRNSDISFSPSLIGAGIISFTPFKNMNVDLITKYVGKQFLDNSSNENRKLNAYALNDVRLNYSVKIAGFKEIGVSLFVNNILNKKYESNGYTYSYQYGGALVTQNTYYPQAGINFLAGATLKF